MKKNKTTKVVSRPFLSNQNKILTHPHIYVALNSCCWKEMFSANRKVSTPSYKFWLGLRERTTLLEENVPDPTRRYSLVLIELPAADHHEARRGWPVTRAVSWSRSLTVFYRVMIWAEGWQHCPRWPSHIVNYHNVSIWSYSIMSQVTIVQWRVILQICTYFFY